jgi:hypothetical protein
MFAPALIVILAGAASAADINGKWKANFDGGGMAIEQTYNFKVDGGKITGTMSDPMLGEAKIASGSLKGDDIEFTVSASGQMGDMTLTFKGKVTGPDEIKLSMSFGGGAGGPGGPGGPGGEGPGGGPGGPGGMELVAKRVK